MVSFGVCDLESQMTCRIQDEKKKRKRKEKNIYIYIYIYILLKEEAGLGNLHNDGFRLNK